MTSGRIQCSEIGFRSLTCDGYDFLDTARDPDQPKAAASVEKLESRPRRGREA